MTSSYRKTVEKLNEQREDLDRLPCNRCETPTLRATLAQYGARCFGCYGAYCAAAREPVQLEYDTDQQRDMRKRLKGRAPAANVLHQADDGVDAAARDAAKRETARRVAEYGRKAGLPT